LPAARKRLNRIAERRMRRNERNYFDIVEALLSERAHEIASLETTEFPGKSLNESAIEDVAALALKMELEKAEQDRVESQQTSAATKAQQDKLFQEAFAATQEALRTKRQSRAAELSRSGRRLLNGGEFDRALTLLTEAFSLYPHPKTEFALARIYMLRGAWSEARTHLLKARPLLPSQKVAISQGLARCALRQNDLKTAQNSIRKLRQLKLSGSEQQMLQLLESDLLIRKGKIVRATKRLASISEKKLNAELKVIYSDLQTRLEAAKRESTKFAQDAKESTQIHPSPIPQHKSHDIQHRGTTRIKPISTGT